MAENGQPDDAIATLRQGLDRHPEFIEARLFLIELLHASHRDDLRDGEVGKLARLLGAYPGFWDAWSACLAAGDKGRDTALALAFLAASFRSGAQGALSWTSVIEHPRFPLFPPLLPLPQSRRRPSPLLPLLLPPLRWRPACPIRRTRPMRRTRKKNIFRCVPVPWPRCSPNRAT